jgi:MarR family transcriptional regulator, 2-MHQ and catechol-resistance regulon repressor
MEREITENEVTLKLFVTLSKAHRTITDLVKEDIKKYGLNTTEFAVLELLYHRGDQPLQQIGQRILLASGSITYVVDKLEEKGYLLRKPCPKDRRITYATISDQGKALLDEIFPRHQLRLNEIFAGLNNDEKNDAISLMKKLGLYADSLT